MPTAVTSRAFHWRWAPGCGGLLSGRISLLVMRAQSCLPCKLVNRMQTDLTEQEFKALVKALADRFERGDLVDPAAFPPDR